MKKVYIDVSIINSAHLEGIGGLQLIYHLRMKDLNPATSSFTIYDIIRAYDNRNSYQRAQLMLSIIKYINPLYVVLTKDLLEQEIAHFRRGTPVSPFLDHLDQATFRFEVENLARGCSDDESKRFIKNCVSEMKAGFPRISKDYLNTMREDTKAKNLVANRILTFYDLINFYRKGKEISRLISLILENSVSPSEIEELAFNLDSFPVLRSIVYSNCYLIFLHITKGTSHSVDMIDDYRHIIDASYCNIFLTADEKQLKAVPHINKDLETLSWSDLLDEIRHQPNNS